MVLWQKHRAGLYITLTRDLDIMSTESELFLVERIHCFGFLLSHL